LVLNINSNFLFLHCMKRRILAAVLLFLFCLTNVGVVVGAHTCLKSNRTDFSLFPGVHSGGCCERVESFTLRKTEGCVEALNLSSEASHGCSRSSKLTRQSKDCCSSVPGFEVSKNTHCPSEQNSRSQAVGIECGLLKTSVEISVCSAESCCRLDKVALLDLHVRTLPEKLSGHTLGLFMPPCILSVGSGFFVSSNYAGSLGKGFSLPNVCTASRLQVWRL
jgi:hypothetical protein